MWDGSDMEFTFPKTHSGICSHGMALEYLLKLRLRVGLFSQGDKKKKGMTSSPRGGLSWISGIFQPWWGDFKAPLWMWDLGTGSVVAVTSEGLGLDHLKGLFQPK